MLDWIASSAFFLNSETMDYAMEPKATLLAGPESIGPLVRQARRAQGLRIDDAASLLGVSVDLMSRLENGQGTVRLDKVMAILDGLGLAVLVVPKEHPWLREAEHAPAAPARSPA